MKEKILTAGVFVLLVGLFAFAANDWKVPWAGKPAHGPDWCEEHGVPEEKCETCNPKLARGGTTMMREREPRPGECPNTLVRITLGPEAAKRVDLALVAVELRPVVETLKANGETAYPPSRYAKVAPRLGGVVREVTGFLGQEVEAGATLAVVESADFSQAKGDYLQALAILRLREKTFEREKELAEKKISSGRELLEARTALEEARLSARRAAQRLSTLGLGEAEVKAVAEKEETSPLVRVVAPFAGTVVEASAVPGETAAPDKPLFGIASLERLWLSIDVYEADYPRVEKDQKVVLTVEGLPGKRFPGKVVAIGGELDDRTRTVRVWADVKNVDGLLRARMFGRAEITIKTAEPKLLVPKAAVQNDGDCHLVFVSPTPNAFQARKIEVGRVYEQGYEIAGGLAAGEKVVTTGSFLLKTEVLRGQMGAG